MRPKNNFLLLCVFICISCGGRNIKTQTSVQQDNLIDSVGRTVSLEELQNIKYIHIEENDRSIVRIDDQGDTIRHDYFVHYLPKYKEWTILIMFDDFSDAPVYYISIIHNNTIYDSRSLDISSVNFDTEDVNHNYIYRSFEILDNYEIKVTEDKDSKGVKGNEMKSYFIDDQGKFKIHM